MGKCIFPVVFRPPLALISAHFAEIPTFWRK
jgi:hypothetical protein